MSQREPITELRINLVGETLITRTSSMEIGVIMRQRLVEQGNIYVHTDKGRIEIYIVSMEQEGGVLTIGGYKC